MTLRFARRTTSPATGRFDVSATQTVRFGPTALVTEPTREQAMVELWSDFPHVAERIVLRVYLAYEGCLGSASGAMEATRARITDACAA